MGRIYTTGEVAAILKVATRTASKMIDRGLIKGYRIPGSRDRRVTHEALQRFLLESGMPVDDPEFCTPLVFALSPDESLCRRLAAHVASGGYRFLHAPTAFDAGLRLSHEYPRLAVLDFAAGKGWALPLASRLTQSCPRTVLVALLNEDDGGEPLPGFAASFPRPFDPAGLEGFLSRFLVAPQGTTGAAR